MHHGCSSSFSKVWDWLCVLRTIFSQEWELGIPMVLSQLHWIKNNQNNTTPSGSVVEKPEECREYWKTPVTLSYSLLLSRAVVRCTVSEGAWTIAMSPFEKKIISGNGCSVASDRIGSKAGLWITPRDVEAGTDPAMYGWPPLWSSWIPSRNQPDRRSMFATR